MSNSRIQIEIRPERANQVTGLQRIDAALRDWLLDVHHLNVSREKVKAWLENVTLHILDSKRDMKLDVARDPKRLLPHDSLAIGHHALEISPDGAVSDWLQSLQTSADPRKRQWTGSPLSIVDETSAWIAIDKPSGLPSVPLRADDPKITAADFIRSLGRLDPKLEAGLEAGAAHRLDTDTSGILLFAKTPAALERLHQAWESPTLHKIYRAVTVPSADAAVLSAGLRIESPIARDAKDAGRVRVIQSSGDMRYARGNAMPALTEILSFRPRGNIFVEIEVRIRTGVQHQIRAHLAHLGFPIAGDPVYAPERARIQSKRLELYSIALGIPGGETGAANALHWIRL